VFVKILRWSLVVPVAGCPDPSPFASYASDFTQLRFEEPMTVWTKIVPLDIGNTAENILPNVNFSRCPQPQLREKTAQTEGRTRTATVQY